MECEYCKEPFNEFGRFTILCARQNTNEPLRNDQDGDDSVLSFCLPECACAYNYYMSHDPEGDRSQKRHLLMEQVYGRRIMNAPPRNMLSMYSKYGLPRVSWIKMCHRKLSTADLEITNKELTNIV